MKNLNLIIIVISIIIVIIFLGIRFSGDKNSSSTHRDKTVQTVTPAFLDSQTNSEGKVSVTATPTNQSDWSFEITLNTHSVDISEDLTQVSVLVDENNNEYKPIEWQGDPPGGHHRKGVLRFGEITPQPRLITLFIHQIGGINVRKFEWLTQL